MAHNLNVTYQDMEAAATRLRAGQAEIEGRLDDLRRLVDELVSAGFVTDRSSKAFGAAYAEFTDGMRRTVQGLDGMGHYLTQAAEAFRSADEQLAGALRR